MAYEVGGDVCGCSGASMDVTFATVDAASEEAKRALRRYFEELTRRFERCFDVDRAVNSVAAILNPPQGLFILGSSDGSVVGCGGIHFMDEATAELRRMWVDPALRGHGIGRKLLTYLEDLAASTGRTAMVLDTNGSLVEAIGLYRSAGYEATEPYNDNPEAHFWFRKVLGGDDAPG